MGSVHNSDCRSELRVLVDGLGEMKKLPLIAGGATYRRRGRGEGATRSLTDGLEVL